MRWVWLVAFVVAVIAGNLLVPLVIVLVIEGVRRLSRRPE